MPEISGPAPFPKSPPPKKKCGEGGGRGSIGRTLEARPEGTTEVKRQTTPGPEGGLRSTGVCIEGMAPLRRRRPASGLPDCRLRHGKSACWHPWAFPAASWGCNGSGCNVRIRLQPRLLPTAFTAYCPLYEPMSADRPHSLFGGGGLFVALGSPGRPPHPHHIRKCSSGKKRNLLKGPET